VILGVIMRLHPGVDDDLITFFAQIPARRRAQAVKAALRAGGMAAYAVAEEADAGEMADLVSGLLY
jgi:hypothetical protein